MGRNGASERWQVQGEMSMCVGYMLSFFFVTQGIGIRGLLSRGDAADEVIFMNRIEYNTTASG